MTLSVGGALRTVTFLVVALIALCAAGGLFFALAHAMSLLGPAVALLWVGVVVAGALALRGREAATSPAFLGAAFATLLALRAATSLAIDAPLISDFKDYHDLAVGVLNGGPWIQDGRPMGYPLLLAAAYGLAGPHPTTGEWLNVFLGGLSGLALWALVQRLAGPVAAGLAVALFAVWPAHALMTALIGTEVVYGCAFLAAMAALVRVAPAGQGWAWAATAGAFTGLAQWVRPTTLALVPAALLWLLVAGRRPHAAAALAGLYLAGLLLVLAPVAEWNHRTQGRWSLSTSSYGGWSLLVGMNQRHHGMWNVDDAATADQLGGLAAVDAYARAEGLRRMQADPLATAGLLARKFPIMWAMEDYGTYWALGTAPSPDHGRMALLTLLAQTFYAAVTGLAAWALWRRRDWDAAWTPLFVGLLLLVGVHSLLEVQGRYHFYWTPVFLALAACALIAPRRAEGSLEA